MGWMAGELRDNRGRGDAEWSWPAIHPEGRKFGLIAAGISLAVLLFLDWEIIGWPMLLLSAGVFAFFRDPERVVPQREDLIVAPADSSSIGQPMISQSRRRSTRSEMPVAISPNLRPSGWIAGQLHSASPRPRLSSNSPAMAVHLGTWRDRHKPNEGGGGGQG